MLCCVGCSIRVPQSATERRWQASWNLRVRVDLLFSKTKHPPQKLSAECLPYYSISRASCSLSSALKSNVPEVLKSLVRKRIGEGRRLCICSFFWSFLIMSQFFLYCSLASGWDEWWGCVWNCFQRHVCTVSLFQNLVAEEGPGTTEK